MPKSHSVPFLGLNTTRPPKPTKPDFRKYRPFRNLLPREFVTDSGQRFEVEVIKPTVACFHLFLLKPNNQKDKIKVRKTNPRLRYLVNGKLVTPNDIMTATKKKGD